NLIPSEWHNEIRTFTEEEFTSIALVENKILRTDSDTISRKYNDDRYNPRDGAMIKAVDDLTAYVETYCSQENGVKSPDLDEARQSISEKYKDAVIGGIDFGRLFVQF
ncbi:MAG: hydrolase, partial [Syntrophorhabdus sp.]